MTDIPKTPMGAERALRRHAYAHAHGLLAAPMLPNCPQTSTMPRTSCKPSVGSWTR